MHPLLASLKLLVSLFKKGLRFAHIVNQHFGALDSQYK
jgi:hypothetical protein